MPDGCWCYVFENKLTSMRWICLVHSNENRKYGFVNYDKSRHFTGKGEVCVYTPPYTHTPHMHTFATLILLERTLYRQDAEPAGAYRANKTNHNSVHCRSHYTDHVWHCKADNEPGLARPLWLCLTPTQISLLIAEFGRLWSLVRSETLCMLCHTI